MKLLYSKSSPFSRKVRACAIALGIERQIELIEVDVYAAPPILIDVNPLGRIPTLITEDGFALFDSPVICEYLNGSTDVIPMIPQAGAQRWRCLRLEALGDGLMDAAFDRRLLELNGDLAADNPLLERRRSAIVRTLDQLEREKLSLHVDVGGLSIACALGYLDLRFPDEDWRQGRDGLTAWFAKMSAHDCLSRTAP